MTAGFVRCPDCGRLMLGQNGHPQPHDCPGNAARATETGSYEEV